MVFRMGMVVRVRETNDAFYSRWSGQVFTITQIRDDKYSDRTFPWFPKELLTTPETEMLKAIKKWGNEN